MAVHIDNEKRLHQLSHQFYMIAKIVNANETNMSASFSFCCENFGLCCENFGLCYENFGLCCENLVLCCE